MSRWKIIELGADQLQVIRPLWEKLKDHHAQLAPQFVDKRTPRTFGARRQELLAKAVSGKLKLDVVTQLEGNVPIAYCVTTLTAERTGEIDSLFVEAEYRGEGIGTELTLRALRWFDENGAAPRTVVVAFANPSAREFYRRFGFLEYSLTLRQPPS